MNTPADMIEVNVIVALPASALQAIVANIKAVTPPDSRGRYHVDMAAKVGEMISEFLLGSNFETYVADIENYEPVAQPER